MQLITLGQSSAYHNGMSHLFLTTLGRRLYALRKDAGMTQEELADKLERVGTPVGRTYISKLESNEGRPSLDVAAALAKILGTTTDYLALLTDNPLPPDGTIGPVYKQPETDKVAQVLDKLPQEQRRQALLFAVEMLHRHRMDKRTEMLDFIADYLETARIEFGEKAAEEIGLLLRPADASSMASGNVDR